MQGLDALVLGSQDVGGLGVEVVLAGGGVLVDGEAKPVEGVVGLVVGDAELFCEVGNEDSPDEAVPIGPDVGEPGVAAGHAGGVGDGYDRAVAHPIAPSLIQRRAVVRYMSSLPQLPAPSNDLTQRGQTGMKNESLWTVQAPYGSDAQRSGSRADPTDAGTVLKVQGDRLDGWAKLYPTADDLTPAPAIQPVISEAADNTF